jgi:hypothetical protein
VTIGAGSRDVTLLQADSIRPSAARSSEDRRNSQHILIGAKILDTKKKISGCTYALVGIPIRAKALANRCYRISTASSIIADARCSHNEFAMVEHYAH